MRNFGLGIMFLLLSGCVGVTGSGKTEGSAGYLQVGKSVYDGKKYAKLFPGSLFDADDSPSVFRLGLAWDERYGDKVHLLVTFPLHGAMSISDLERSADSLKMKIDGKEVKLERVKNSVLLKEENIIASREFGAEIRYAGSRSLVESMLAARNVVLQLNAANRLYEGSLKLAAKKKNYYVNAEYTAINGMQRFYQAVWGKGK